MKLSSRFRGTLGSTRFYATHMKFYFGVPLRCVFTFAISFHFPYFPTSQTLSKKITDKER